MQQDKMFNSAYEQLWPELSSASKVNNHISNRPTRLESSNSSIQTNQLHNFNTALQQSDDSLKAEIDESLMRNHNYESDFTILNSSTSSSNIFNQPLVLGIKPSRLSYTGNFSSVENHDMDTNSNNQCFIQDTSEVWKQEHIFGNVQVRATTSSVEPTRILHKTQNNFQSMYNKNPNNRHLTEQNKKLNFTNVEVQAKELEFSLEQAADCFPELNALKRLKNNKSSSVKEHESSNSVNMSKRISKSWKPKVKDPIFINLDQALQSIPEKNKPEPKKTTQATQQVPLPANILDSDKPQQRKGKVRPDKPKKPSKLKERILEIRQEKQKTPNSCEDQATVDELTESISSLLVKPDTKDVEENDYLRDSKATPQNCQIECRQLDNQAKEETCQVVNIHSRKFREYCTNCITEELVTNICALLEKVAQFQDRLFVQNPLKASAKRRYVAGIHQTIKYLNVKKVKVLVIAPDLEMSPGKGGLDEKISHMVKEAESQEILCVFGPNRKRLGRSVRKNALVACVAVLSYEGAEEQLAKVTESLNVAREKYLSLTQRSQNPLQVEPDEESEKISKQLIFQEDSQHEDVTSTLLAKLRDEISPAGQLLRAINPRDWCGD